MLAGTLFLLGIIIARISAQEAQESKDSEPEDYDGTLELAFPGMDGLPKVTGYIGERGFAKRSIAKSSSTSRPSSAAKSSSSTESTSVAKSSPSAKSSSSTKASSTTSATSTSSYKSPQSSSSSKVPSESSKKSSSSPAHSTAKPQVLVQCAQRMTGATTISGTGTLPKPTSFVKTSGQTLSLDGKPFKIVGTSEKTLCPSCVLYSPFADLLMLCNDENVSVSPNNYYTDKGRIREALAIAVAMGANTIRVLSCGSSVASQYSIEPARSNFAAANAAQWDTHDYVIFAAREYGLRVIITLTDDYDTYYGSKYSFLRWRNASTGNFGNAFYTQGNVIADFKDLGGWLTRADKQSTKEELISVERGEYLRFQPYSFAQRGLPSDSYPPASWTTAISATIKSLAPSQLIIDGSDGFYNYSTKATAPGLNVADVDIVSDHGYPRNIGLLQAEIPLAKAANKVFFIGEYDWTPNTYQGEVDLGSYLSYIEGSSINGDMIWNIQGHDAQCCNFVTHNDGYSLYYGNKANTAAQQQNILLVTQHFYRREIFNQLTSYGTADMLEHHRMTGRKIPTSLPVVACPQPSF
ncbi:mannan endo-1,4-beta-mannosidase, partial [Phenoliferia sp. Uapishka_3]